jgi:hypothetical protein
MAFFETTKLKNTDGQQINPATEDSLTLLRRILLLLKPLQQITGGGSNRLSVDVNNITGGTIGTVTTVTGVTTVSTVSTVTGVTTVSTLTNQSQIAGVNAFEQLRAINRVGYATGIRANLTFT